MAVVPKSLMAGYAQQVMLEASLARPRNIKGYFELQVLLGFWIYIIIIH